MGDAAVDFRDQDPPWAATLTKATDDAGYGHPW